MRTVLLILGMLLPTLGIAQTYKCIDGGRTVYQATPCAGEGKPVQITPTAGVEAPRVPAPAPVLAREEAPAKPKPQARVLPCIVVGKGPVVACVN